MKYNFKSQIKIQNAREYLDILIKKQCICEIREMRLKRTLDQNALYWLWLTAIQNEAGIKKEELHCMYRALFLPRDEDFVLKYIRRDSYLTIINLVQSFVYFQELPQLIDIISFSTSKEDIDTKQFTWYLNKIREHARTTMGIILLTLEDKNFQEFYKEYGFN